MPAENHLTIAFDDPSAFCNKSESLRTEPKASPLPAKTENDVKINRLSASIAHELKNPLAAIKGFAQLISIECDTPDFKMLSDTIGQAADNHRP